MALADTAEPVLAAELMRAGAIGVAHISQSVADILVAVRTTLGGSRYLSPAYDAKRIDQTIRDSHFHALTPREREIFVLLGRGYRNEVIGRQLFISPRTVETHRQRIMRKLRAHSISDLIMVAKRLDMIVWPTTTATNSVALHP